MSAENTFSTNPPAPAEDFGVPYSLLTASQRAILQYSADGLSDIQIGEQMGVSLYTVENHKSLIGWFGAPENERTEKLPTGLAVLALIQDGINQGYVLHQLDSDQEVKISSGEKQILDSISSGVTLVQLAKDLHLKRGPLDGRYKTLTTRLNTKNIHNTVARYTELKRRGLLSVVDDPKNST